MPTVVYLIFCIEFLYEILSTFFVEAFNALHWQTQQHDTQIRTQPMWEFNLTLKLKTQWIQFNTQRQIKHSIKH